MINLKRDAHIVGRRHVKSELGGQLPRSDSPGQGGGQRIQPERQIKLLDGQRTIHGHRLQQEGPLAGEALLSGALAGHSIGRGFRGIAGEIPQFQINVSESSGDRFTTAGVAEFDLTVVEGQMRQRDRQAFGFALDSGGP